MDNKVLKVTDKVQWIGVLDPDIVTFDVVMETEYGTTYNSYFIDAEKKVVVETTKEKFWDVYEAKIKQVCNPEEIEYIILNHTEPDHSGNMMNLIKLAPNATVVGTGNAIRYLQDLFVEEFRFQVVKDGDELDLGNMTMRFIGAPNLHWPDSMYSYLVEEKLLFSCDSFGAHFCHTEMYDDQVGDYEDAFIYYFDVILKPFSKFMLKAIEKIDGLDIEAICTGHGPILRTHWKRLVAMSKEMSERHLALPEKKRVFIPYVSAYQKTGMIAEQIAAGVQSLGDDYDVDLVDIELTLPGDLDMYLTKCSALIVGSPTINQNILLPVYKLFALVSPLRDKGKPAGAFGSYGWSGEGEKIIPTILKQLKLNVEEESLFVKFTPDTSDLEAAFVYGQKIASRIPNSV